MIASTIANSRAVPKRRRFGGVPGGDGGGGIAAL